jgi:opacity protein-like surface antigen
MFTNTKIALAAALIVGAASAALANDVETNPSSAQSAREWAEYLGQNQKHEKFASNTYDSPDWAPIYSGSTIRREPAASAYERNADEFSRVPSAHLSHKMDHHQR